MKKKILVSITFPIVISLFLLGYSCSQNDQASEGQKPNVIFLLVDDLGWTDLTCYGSTFYETPNIDRLASGGMLFTNAYAAASVCSPTRASILTGKYPARLNITDWIPGQDPQNRPLLGSKDKHELPLEEQTIAEALASEGYETAFFGKWHLGEPGFFPENQGFGLNIGGHWAGQPASYFYPYKNDRKRWDVPGLDGGKDGEYLTDRLTQESIQFIENNKEGPFLLYFAYYNVHTPIQAKPELVQKYERKMAQYPIESGEPIIEERDAITKQKQDNPTYAGMVQSVDESVGALLDKLEELGLSDNTVIIFTSDNGGLTTLPKGYQIPTAVTPLRAGKGWLYEGGIRVPAIIKWPGKVEKNSRSSTPIISTDFYPTILEMTGTSPIPNQHNDGESLLPLLTQQGDLSREALFWHFPHYHGSKNRPSAAIRMGNYKLIEWFEDQSQELYNLEADISEQNNLMEEMPKKAAELSTLLHQWQKNIGALKPQPNPNFKVSSNEIE